jgi:hypothetical protein
MDSLSVKKKELPTGQRSGLPTALRWENVTEWLKGSLLVLGLAPRSVDAKEERTDEG